MISLGTRIKIFACREPTDMRASYDTLTQKTKKILGKDPFCGHLFLFVNRRRSSCKCLFFDGTGFVILAKRLEKGRFSKFNPLYKKELVFTSSEFALFFEGAQINKRFIESPQEVMSPRK